ncbi:MAG: amidohydrolase family protein [Spirochaetota bacterium]
MDSIFAQYIYTGKTLAENSYLHFEQNRVTDISPQQKADPAGSYHTITPAFIDPHCHMGMQRWGEPVSEAETNERMDSILALADALDSVQMDDGSFQDSIEEGVLYSCVMPGSGNIIGGRAAVIRNYGKNTSLALIRKAGVKAAFGYNTMSATHWKGKRPYTRMGALALLRHKLYEVKQKTEKLEKASPEKKVEFSLSNEEQILASILDGREMLRAHVHKIDDVAALLRLADEFGLRVSVEHGCDINSVHMFTELKKRNIPVIYGPMDSFAYKVELKHENWRNTEYLIQSGVRFGLMTDHPVILQKMLLYQLRWFLRVGMDKSRAVSIITLENAHILGIQDLLGSLEHGKLASFICWDGDPFSLTSRPAAVYGEGQLIHSLQ